MSRIWAIALNTFREAVRDRILHGVIGLASAVLVFTLALGEMSLNQERRVVEDIGLAAISFFSVVVAIFLGSSLLYKEIERKTLYVVLPKPVHRWEFIVGKFGGIVLTGLVFIAIMGGILSSVMGVQAGGRLAVALGVATAFVATLIVIFRKLSDATLLLIPLAFLYCAVAMVVAASADGHPVDVFLVLRSLLLNSAEVALLTSVALFFSSFSTPFLTGGFTFGVWLVGRSAQTMSEMRSKLLGDEIKTFLRGLAKVVPNFDLFVPGHATMAASAYEGPWMYTGTSIAYAAGYCLVLLVMASAVFSRRDFA